MISSNFPADHDIPVVADTSVVINLNATGFSSRIIQALPNPFFVTKNVLGEAIAGSVRGHRDGEKLKALIEDGVVALADLGERGISVYASLVEGPVIHTLDDGEASTIARATEIRGIALIDERKATRICREKFPETSTVMTVDLLFHELVGEALGEERQKEAVYNALHRARMRVPREVESSVVAFIGKDLAASCLSLSRGSRL